MDRKVEPSGGWLSVPALGSAERWAARHRCDIRVLSAQQWATVSVCCLRQLVQSPFVIRGGAVESLNASKFGRDALLELVGDTEVRVGTISDLSRNGFAKEPRRSSAAQFIDAMRKTSELIAADPSDNGPGSVLHAAGRANTEYVFDTSILRKHSQQLLGMFALLPSSLFPQTLIP